MINNLDDPHTDIIVKDKRQVQYGHKLNLAQGKNRLILDLLIEVGNPADSDRFIPIIERQEELYGRVPCSDEEYACRANLEEAKAMRISDVAFNKIART